MISTILAGVGGGILLEALGMLGAGAGKKAAVGLGVKVVWRLLVLLHRLRDRMSDDEKKEADDLTAQASRL